MKNFTIPDEVINLIRLTLPDEVHNLDNSCSLASIVNITKKWAIPPERRLKLPSEDPYLPYYNDILKAVDSLQLRRTKLPRFTKYDSVVILGATGLSHFAILKDLLFFYQENHINFSKIFLLGGDRPVNLQYDSMENALKYYPEYFKRKISNKEILNYQNEMEVMEKVTSAVKFPNELKDISIISVFTPKSSSSGVAQATTSDTIISFLKNYKYTAHLPILFLGTLPYIVRQGMQAQLLMPNVNVDIAATYHPYLETIDTPLQGELPPTLYLDELHWLFCSMEKWVTSTNSLSFKSNYI